jgi:hypothetical protein
MTQEQGAHRWARTAGRAAAIALFFIHQAASAALTLTINSFTPDQLSLSISGTFDSDVIGDQQGWLAIKSRWTSNIGIHTEFYSALPTIIENTISIGGVLVGLPNLSWEAGTPTWGDSIHFANPNGGQFAPIRAGTAVSGTLILSAPGGFDPSAQLQLLSGFSATTMDWVRLEDSGAINCSNVVFIGARGSGEQYLTSSFGMGRTVKAVYDNVAAQVPGLQAWGVIYDAIPAVSIPDFPSDVQKSVEIGRETTNAFMSRQLAACPNQKFLLVGYSQGAMVVADVINGLNANTASHVVGVGMLGDPLFNPKLKEDAGDYDKRYGGILGQRPEIEKSFLKKTTSFCAKGDFICNSSLVNIGSCTIFFPDSCPHYRYDSYPSNSSFAQMLGDVLVKQAKLAAPTTVTFSAKGRVNRIDDSGSLLRNFLSRPVAIGDPVTFTVSYSTNTVDSDVDPALGVYWGFLGGTSATTLKVANNAPITKPISSSQNTFFLVRTASSGDPGYNFQGNDNCTSCFWSSIQLQLDGALTPITSDALPTTAPILTMFRSGLILLWVNVPGNTGDPSFVWADVESIN